MNDAYNRNDIDTVMAFFDEDAVFDHATGPDIKRDPFYMLKEHQKGISKLVLKR